MSAEDVQWQGPPGTLESVETHTARVFLTADRAYKVRKPVRFAFVDYTDPAVRHATAQAELALNRVLAPDVYLAVQPLVLRDGELVLAGADAGAEQDAVDHVVLMRRFAESDTLAARITAQAVPPDAAAAIGQLVAAFHRDAPGVPGGGAAHALARVDRNGEELIALRSDWPDGADVARVVGALQRAVLRRAAQLDERAGAGCWRDGHGDLRADHVVLEARGLRIVDRLEFDAGLRGDDVAADLAFLLMDLEARGARELARSVLSAYRQAGGDAGDDGLIACWSAYRATVAAKVAHLRAGQGGRAADAVAAQRLTLARRLLWRATGVGVIVVCGPPASGKSTLARLISDACGAPVLSSDVVRKAMLGMAASERAGADAYTAQQTAAVYGELGRRAAQLRGEHDTVIVDATMHRREERAAFAAQLGEAGLQRWVVCDVPRAVARRRAAARLADPGRHSDATPEIADALAAQWEDPDELAATDVLTLRADRPAEALGAAVEDWIT